MLHVALFNHEPTHLRIYRALLESHKYYVSAHHEDDEGLAEMAAHPPDAIVLGNFHTFQPDEMVFLNRLRAEPSLACTPIIICTTGKEAAAMAALDHYAPLHILPKPFGADAFLQTVRRCHAPPAVNEEQEGATRGRPGHDAPASTAFTSP